MSAQFSRRWTASLLLGAVMAGLLASPALAVSTDNVRPGGGSIDPTIQTSAVVRRPDGRVRVGAYGYGTVQVQPAGGPFLGNDFYNTTGAHQTAVRTNAGAAEVEGAWYAWDVSIQNDGNRADRFTVKATGAATRAWIVIYRYGTRDITAAVVAGTFRTPSLAPGATYLIHARITIGDGGGNITRMVAIRSVANPAKIDTVKFAYRFIYG